MRLLGAQIAGNLTCSAGTFKNAGQARGAATADALSAHGINAKGDVFFRGLKAESNVRFSGAQIQGDLDCSGGTFHGDLNLKTAAVERNLRHTKIVHPKLANLDLTNASAGALVDDVDSWPAAGNLHLNGFVYGRISEGPIDAETRLRWLFRQRSFASLPSRQLAKVLMDTGDEDGAQKVLIETERRQRKGEWTSPLLEGQSVMVTARCGHYDGSEDLAY